MARRRRGKIAGTPGNMAMRADSLWERTAALRKRLRRRVKRARTVYKDFRDSLYEIRPSRAR